MRDLTIIIIITLKTKQIVLSQIVSRKIPIAQNLISKIEY